MSEEGTGTDEAPAQADEAAASIPLESIVIGEDYEGVVNNVVTYGAFVDIGTEVRASTPHPPPRTFKYRLYRL